MTRARRLIDGVLGHDHVQGQFAIQLHVLGIVVISARVLFGVVADEVRFGSDGEAFEVFPIFGANFLALFLAAFLLGMEATLDTLESPEVAVEIGNGFALLEAIEEAALDKGGKGFVTSREMHLALDTNGIGKLAELFERAMIGVIMGVKAAESRATGHKGETAFRSRAGQDFEGDVVGVFVAGSEDELLIFLGEGFEFVHAFHVYGSFFLPEAALGDRQAGNACKVYRFRRKARTA